MPRSSDEKLQDELVPKAGSSEPETQQFTPEGFITKAPLFTVARIEQFTPPGRISFECYGVCKKETTWLRLYDTIGLAEKAPDDNIRSVAYECTLCTKCHLTVVYRREWFENREVKEASTGAKHLGNPNMPQHMPITRSVLVGVMKIGQHPAPTVTLPKGLEKGLGQDAAGLYRKSLICRNNGFGLAAAIYIRRVVEDKTNELIEVAAKNAEVHGVDPLSVKTMRDALDPEKYTTYDKKLEYASTVFPRSLMVGGYNPLKTLFGLVSKGVHDLDEAACIAIADDTAEVFDHVFTRLKADLDSQKSFIEKMKKLS